ncbi:MAG: SDR family oxidoreductase [Bacteroidetes bacterium]|nr:SDR family oxidoreductase [Bacteroidota bacterium]MBS1541972.1 SDR family oxidoreductase [Bacteroidota bacterium]
MDLHLQGKVIIVTGGAKGIGEAIVWRLVEEKAIPVIVDRDTEALKNLDEKLTSKKTKFLLLTADLTQAEECKMAVAKTVKELNRIDGLVNNAGINDGVGLAKGSYEAFLQSLHKNLIHYYLMAHHALPYLIKNKGSIVNISSKVAVTGQGNTSAYAAANGGRNAFTREWAVELLPHGIRVNGVVVSECFTPLYKSWIQSFANPQEKLKNITDKIPLGKRMTTPEEIANTVAFLLSDVSSHTTGQLLYVDGGYVHLDRAIT